MLRKILITTSMVALLAACDKPADNSANAVTNVKDMGQPTLFTDASMTSQLAYEKAFMEMVDTKRLYDYHTNLASVPHVAGSPGDQQIIDYMTKEFTDMGLEVEVHEFWALLPTPISASVTVTSPDVVQLQLREDPLEIDPDTSIADKELGYNGYSGSGTVEANVVYVNRGTKEDYDYLVENGISLKGKIAIARYGGNFRGYKARFAEEAGAVGLLIFTDPGDSGYHKDFAYPEGSADTPTSMQRGSLATTDNPGDALTQGWEATKDAKRDDPKDVVGLPKIPVQPLSWSAASEILSRMTGAEIPMQSWQGGLPFRYRMIGGDDLKVKLSVDQKWEIKKSANVLGTLRGSEDPDTKIMIGSHHDAWIYGASDAQSGTIVVMETARILSELAKKGMRPKRSLVFAGWGAEEQGIIGSGEWTEANKESLKKNMLAYVNLDGAAGGLRLGASATPSIQRAVINASKRVPYGDGTLLDHWLKGSKAEPGSRPRFGDMGGGSDHAPLIAMAGVPSVGIGGRGTNSGGYHSFYDTLTWYRRNVGTDYEPAKMVTNIVGVSILAMANSDLVDLDTSRYVVDTRKHLKNLSAMKKAEGFLTTAKGQKVADEFKPIWDAVARFEASTAPTLTSLNVNTMSGDEVASWNKKFNAMEDLWMSEEGLPDRNLRKNLFGATDGNAGYSAWMLPMIRWSIEYKDKAYLAKVIPEYVGIFDKMTAIANGQ